MYRIKLYITPEKGMEDPILETSGRDRKLVNPLLFYTQMKPELDRFKKRIKILTLRGKEERIPE